MNTIIVKHDNRGDFEVIGTDGEPVRIILLEDDHMGAANINVEGRKYIGYEIAVESKPEIVTQAIESLKPLDF